MAIVEADTRDGAVPAASVPVRIVDCDVHLKPRTTAELHEYMAEPWRSRKNFWRLFHNGPIYRPYVNPHRTDSTPEGGGSPGSDPGLVEKHLFADAGVDIAISSPNGAPLLPVIDPDVNAAVSRAINLWQADTWVGRYNRLGRFRASITVPVNNPAAAVREIEHWADHPSFIQVMIPHYGGAPYGAPRFHPIWEAAARHGLPVAMHSSKGAEDPCLSPVGHFQRYAELNGIGFPLVYAAHLVSFITEGVFAKYPDFRVAFIEGGFSWSGPVMSRLDRNYERLRDEIPEVTAKPSSYLRDHVRFSSQPVEEPEDAADLVRLYDWSDAEHLLMFSSDYPHWDYDHPARAISTRLDASVRRRIYGDNAREFYGLPEIRPRDELDA
jgi:predicted TIM-barrel fold metal-dependent hydrolase